MSTDVDKTSTLTPWIGFDFDGTLAEYKEGQSIWTLGAPIPLMVDRLKTYRHEGVECRIMTARIALTNDSEDAKEFQKMQQTLLNEWCEIHLGEILPLTAQKDFMMTALYDDRTIQVIPNTGLLLSEEFEKLKDRYEAKVNYYRERHVD